MPNSPDSLIPDEFFMLEALKQAQMAHDADEVPIGAVIVHNNRVIAKAHNQVEMLKDPTAHAEILAITQACGALKSKWLHDCTMYVTLESCSMCAGALVLSRVSRLVIGAMDPKAGACGSVLNISNHAQLNHRIDIKTGLLAQECGDWLKNFFEQKRERAQNTG